MSWLLLILSPEYKSFSRHHSIIVTINYQSRHGNAAKIVSSLLTPAFYRFQLAQKSGNFHGFISIVRGPAGQAAENFVSHFPALGVRGIKNVALHIFPMKQRVPHVSEGYPCYFIYIDA